MHKYVGGLVVTQVATGKSPRKLKWDSPDGLIWWSGSRANLGTSPDLSGRPVEVRGRSREGASFQKEGWQRWTGPQISSPHPKPFAWCLNYLLLCNNQAQTYQLKTTTVYIFHNALCLPSRIYCDKCSYAILWIFLPLYFPASLFSHVYLLNPALYSMLGDTHKIWLPVGEQKWPPPNVSQACRLFQGENNHGPKDLGKTLAFSLIA